MKLSIPQKLLLLSFLIISGNAILGYTVYINNQKLQSSGNWVQHTEQVISQSVKIYSSAKDIETASRGFVITRDSAYLAPMFSSGKLVINYTTQLRQLINDNPQQIPRVDSLKVYLNRLLVFSSQAVELRSKEGLDKAVSQISGKQGKYYSDCIRQLTDAIEQEELILLQQRKQANELNLMEYHRISLMVFVLMAILTLLVLIAAANYLFKNKEERKRAADLVIANKNLVYQSGEKRKRAGELVIANKELSYQNNEKEKRAAELAIADEELFYQSSEKEKRAAELIIANKELSYQNDEKGKREKELVIANKELSYQNDEKEKRAAELIVANKELAFESGEKGKRAAELKIANKELSYQNDEKEKREEELVIANIELSFQNDEKEKRAAELVIANKELIFQNDEKGKRAAELVVANVELLYQNKEKEKRAAELVIANDELLFQNNEKEKRAAELLIANKELSFQNREKEKRAIELAFANDELLFQSDVRKIAEKKLSQSESRLKEAQAISRTGNFEVDTINHFTEWSDGMYEIYGINKGEAKPSTELFLSFVHPDDLKQVKAMVHEAYKILKSYSVDFRFIHHNSTIRYGYLEAKFELGDNDQPVRFFGVLQDITESKLADIERAKMVNDLMVRNNDLEQFAYIISHNLRAPVANIIGASNALNDVDINDEDKDILTKAINTSVMRLDDVVQDLNHILQVKGGINETKEIVRFSELVDDIKTSIKSSIDKFGITVEHDFSQYNVFLTIKPYLYSIFYNLISNSVKYCQREIPCVIKIESRRSKNVLQLVFADNGIGIDLEKNGNHVFGLYKRFHPNIEGKGMGLYMVKTQVEILGGTIGIKSIENEGTEFIIEFKL